MRRFSAALMCISLAAGFNMPVAAWANTGDEVSLLSGQLTNDSGQGVPSKGDLTLYAWPSNDLLNSLSVGESAKLVPIAQAEADARGNFEFRASDMSVLHRYSNNGEPVNVTVAGTSDEDRYWFASTVDPAAPENEVHSGRSSLARGAGPLTIAPADRSNARADQSQEYTDAEAYQDKFCGAVLIGSYDPVPAQVGATYVHSSGATADYQFTAGAHSTLGVGISSSGAYGSFDAGGTSSLSADFMLDYVTNTWGSRYNRATVVPKKFRTTCYTPDGVPYNSWYEVRATSYTGGGSSLEGSSFTTTAYCTDLSAGMTFTKNSSTAITWSAGLKVASRIGVNLSSQSGFTSASKLVIKSGSKPRNICGHYGYPGGTSPRSIKVSAT